ncbi:hypothetical protein GCM10012275_24970 [Longimycelium tulufanense]|uniref:HTH cro/C1-type domain-containing protein n=1 Tax=Longimycelium tulufanense TaxID=907463 RepID=A0A8J3CDL7_9PSEU|nr:helix-turn-helix transcriptional regulator [Longimycelium tulufanense]GGM52983.1 hypothetical protein GCM10012275_24970 [Longimycelium tulufanense]
MKDAYRPWVQLRVIREKDGHSQTSLAKVAGMSRALVCRLENGDRKPNARHIARLAGALKVPKSMLQPTPSDADDEVIDTLAEELGMPAEALRERLQTLLFGAGEAA